jgi:signal transduction histidine kinase
MATQEGAAEAQLYRALLAQASDLAAISTADGTFRYTSPSKIEAGHLSLEVQPLDLRQVVRDVVGIFTTQVRAKGLQISAHVDPAVPPLLEGDPVRLRLILLNLVGNAVKFTAHGEVSIGVALMEESPQGALLRVTVRDTGIGIPSEVQATPFEPFTQADASTTRRYGEPGWAWPSPGGW